MDRPFVVSIYGELKTAPAGDWLMETEADGKLLRGFLNDDDFNKNYEPVN